MAALLFFEMMFTYARLQVKCQLYRRVRDIHLPYIRCAIPRLGACREIGYACSVSPTSQRMAFARRVNPGGLLLGVLHCAKKKPAIDADSGFPVLPRPQRQVWILCADRAGKCRVYLPALSQRSGYATAAGLFAAG